MPQTSANPQPPRPSSATSWTLIDQVVHGEVWQRRDALDTLLKQYLPAIRAYVLAKRWAKPGDVDDLVQEFVTSQVLDNELISKVRREKGRFRSYLLTALRNFWVNQLRKKQLVTTEIVTDPPGPNSPDAVFEGEWAKLVICEAIQQMRRRCHVMGRGMLWTLFELRLLGPIFEGANPPSYNQLIETLGIESPAQAANLLVTAKRMFARVLRDVIAQYILDEGEIEEEISDLMRSLEKGKPSLHA